MDFGVDLRTRKETIRFKSFDYSSNNAYFFTICTDDKKKYLDKSIQETICATIETVSQKYSIQVHAVSISLNHIHGLVTMPGNKEISLSKYVGLIKVRTTQSLMNKRRDRSVLSISSADGHACPRDKSACGAISEEMCFLMDMLVPTILKTTSGRDHSTIMSYVTNTNSRQPCTTSIIIIIKIKGPQY